MLSVYTKGSWYPDLEKGKWLVFNCFPLTVLIPPGQEWDISYQSASF
jgi:hypothetical protein